MTVEIENQVQNPVKTFDFENHNVLQMSLEDLKQTAKEDSVLRNPIKGIYHYELIENIQQILLSHNLTMQIDEIFAAQNKMRETPGVSILPAVEAVYGPRAINAHILRRVFANISVRNYDTDEFTTNVAIAFHQNGIQVAYGTMVKVCHNQCIMSPERVLSTDRFNPIGKILEKFDSFMGNLEQTIAEEHETIERMRQIQMTPHQIVGSIGMFQTMRVLHDTSIKEIKNKKMYPLNQTQLNSFVEKVYQRVQEDGMSLWEFYNCATELYKADKMEIPNMFSQHLALNEFTNNIMARQ